MTLEEIKENGMNRNAVAAGQAVLGLVVQFGVGLMPHKEQEEPAFVVDSIPVYHIGYNPYELERPSLKQRMKWGEFIHPYMMIGMPDVPGKVKLYVNAGDEKYYIMIACAQLDPSYSGPSYPFFAIACWTPKVAGDSRIKAGERMFHAMLMHMDDLSDEHEKSTYADDMPHWESEWEPSARCLTVFRKVRA
ncbi:MAG: hypothetical protein LW707_10805 [Sphingobacteriales bacterium]|jgi:hypothetical protein|nr:hypothetical protein [Sphingobacteriales bacterium]